MLTNDHPLISGDGWKKIEELSFGAYLGEVRINRLNNIKPT